MGFLDNLKGSIAQGADRVKFETDKLQKTGRLRGEVDNLQQQIATNFGQLGQRAYELHNDGRISAPEIGSLVQIVNDLQQRLIATQQELERVQNEQFVPEQPAPPPPAPMYPPQGQDPTYGAGSGHVPMGSTDMVQPDAGTTPIVPPQPVDAGQYACPGCGYSLPGGSAFCPNCGTKLNQP